MLQSQCLFSLYQLILWQVCCRNEPYGCSCKAWHSFWWFTVRHLQCFMWEKHIKQAYIKPICLFASIDYVYITIYGVIMRPDLKTLKACHWITLPCKTITFQCSQNTMKEHKTEREFGFELIRRLIYALLSMFNPVNRCAAHNIESSRRATQAEVIQQRISGLYLW